MTAIVKLLHMLIKDTGRLALLTIKISINIRIAFFNLTLYPSRALNVRYQKSDYQSCGCHGNKFAYYKLKNIWLDAP